MAESYINYIKLPDGNVAKFSLPNALKVGKKTYNGSTDITITAADLGLSQALKLVGVTSTALVDGAKTNPIVINGKSHTPSIGDVVLSADKNREFAWVQGDYWEELGSENSYALKTVTISAGNGLSGGGQLSSDVTLSVNFGNISNLGETTNNGNSVQVARADHIHGLTGITSNVSFTNSSATFTSNAKIVIGNNSYGNSLPNRASAVEGQIYFKLV